MRREVGREDARPRRRRNADGAMPARASGTIGHGMPCLPQLLSGNHTRRSRGCRAYSMHEYRGLQPVAYGYYRAHPQVATAVGRILCAGRG